MTSKRKGSSSYSPRDASGKKKPFLSIGRDEFEIQTFAAGGPGGQHQNTSNTGVRIIHRDSGARGESRDSRSQHQNKRAALARLVEDPRFRIWLNRKMWDKIRPEQQVEKDMQAKNLRVEGKKDGRWVPIEETEGQDNG
jgi:protein subunit release factor B